MKSSMVIEAPKKNAKIVPVKRKAVKEFALAIARSGLPIHKVAKLHFRVSGQTIRNILEKKTTRTNKKTVQDLEKFVAAFSEHAPINVDHMQIMNRVDHDALHSHEEKQEDEVMHEEAKSFGAKELHEIIRNSTQLVDSDLDDATKVNVLKTLLHTVC